MLSLCTSDLPLITKLHAHRAENTQQNHCRNMKNAYAEIYIFCSVLFKLLFWNNLIIFWGSIKMIYRYSCLIKKKPLANELRKNIHRLNKPDSLFLVPCCLKPYFQEKHMSSIYGSRCLRGVALSQLYSQQAATCTLVAMWRVRTQPQLLLMNLPAKKTGQKIRLLYYNCEKYAKLGFLKNIIE